MGALCDRGTCPRLRGSDDDDLRALTRQVCGARQGALRRLGSATTASPVAAVSTPVMVRLIMSPASIRKSTIPPSSYAAPVNTAPGAATAHSSARRAPVRAASADANANARASCDSGPPSKPTPIARRRASPTSAIRLGATATAPADPSSVASATSPDSTRPKSGRGAWSPPRAGRRSRARRSGAARERVTCRRSPGCAPNRLRRRRAHGQAPGAWPGAVR